MLLKKWVTRDGKNATTDALTSVLTKINRIDIVTLLEGPIFDYGNISGTRSFADENSVFHDPVDGHPSLQVELETPTGLHYPSPTPFQQDDYFSDISSIESPLRTPSRLSDGVVPSQGDVEHSADGPPVVTAEDTSLEDSKLEDSMPLTEIPEAVAVDESQSENVYLSWQNETSSGNLEPPAQARRITGGLLDRLDDSPDQCRDSITSYLKGEPGKFEANGSHAEVTPEAKTKSYFPESQNDVGKQSAKETLKPKIPGPGRVDEPSSSLAAYQKALEETSKFVIEEPKPCMPVSMKKMSRTSPTDGKPRLNLHEEEGSNGSEQKQGEGYKVKTKKEIRHVEKKSHS